MHRHTHTRTRAYTHIYTHTHTCTDNTRTRAYTHIHTYTHIHAQTHTHIHKPFRMKLKVPTMGFMTLWSLLLFPSPASPPATVWPCWPCLCPHGTSASEALLRFHSLGAPSLASPQVWECTGVTTWPLATLIYSVPREVKALAQQPLWRWTGPKWPEALLPLDQAWGDSEGLPVGLTLWGWPMRLSHQVTA